MIALKNVIIIFLYFLVFFRSGNMVFSQNLVFNPSFELLDKCPDGDVYGISATTPYASGWLNPNALTPDLFSNCFTDLGPQVPENGIGYQYPRTGQQYVGIYAFDVPEGREYLQTRLLYPLENSKRYCFTAYFSVAEYYSNIIVRKLGAYLSSERPERINAPNLYGFLPQIIYSGDTLNQLTDWLKFEGEYIASGGEQYLTIGNFFSDSFSDTLTIDNSLEIISPHRICYFYIDDVSLECCDPLGCGYNIPNSFTPNNDGFNDTWDIFGVLPGTIVQVYNRWGNKVFESNNYLGDWKGDNLPDGTYYYLVNGADGQFYKGFLEILR